MEGATLTRPQPGPSFRARLGALPWPTLALGVLVVAVLVLFFAFPTYPNYDSYYSLIWGRELIHGDALSFDAYRAPTEHPLAVFLGAGLSLLGRGADRVLIFLSMASFVVLAAGMYRLGRLCFTPLIGFLAALFLVTRFDFAFLAIRGYIDVSYLAVIVWAAVLEVQRPRRGMPVLALLVLAGLMRPEAWILIGLYFLWIAWPATWAQRAMYAAVSAIAPLVWTGLDYAVTGKPLFSLQHTSGLAEELGRTKSLTEVPGAMAHFLINLDTMPILLAGVAGVVLALLMVPRRAIMPAVLLGIGLGTFLLVGAAGLSVIDRYLLVASLMMMVFGAVAVGGWTMLVPGRLRTGWMVAGSVVLVVGIVLAITRVNFTSFENELTFRDDSHRSLVAVLDNPGVRRAMACGPLSVPNHKLLPDVRWVLDASESEVRARADPRVDPLSVVNSPLLRGGALVTTDRVAALRQSFTTDLDDTLNALPPQSRLTATGALVPLVPGFQRAVPGRYYGVYARC